MKNVRTSNLKTMNDQNTAKQAGPSFLEQKPKITAHKFAPREDSDSDDMSESVILSNVSKKNLPDQDQEI